MKKKFKSQRKGAVLMTVLTVAMMMVVIVAASIDLVAHTTTKTQDEYRKKQAYFAASSCIKAFVAETTNITVNAGNTYEQVAEAIDKLQKISMDNTFVPVQIDKLNASGGVAGPASNDNPRWKDVTVEMKVEQVNAGGSLSTDPRALKVISRATYLGQTQQVVAYLSLKPLSQSAFVPNALELIGTDGGNSNGGFNNINVYGNTGAPLGQSHTDNTVYTFNTNGTTFYGDCSILGSSNLGVSLQLKSNPYYVSQDLTPETTPGCTLQVSHTLHVSNNSPKITSNMVKNNTDAYDLEPVGANCYNFINAQDAAIFSADSGFQVGNPGSDGTVNSADAKMVDVYSSFVVFGKMNSVAGLSDACANTSVDPSEYHSKMDADSQGQEGNFYSNIYSDGDIHICVSLSQVDIRGTIYLSNGKKILDASGNDITSSFSNVVTNYDWKSEGKRKTRPRSPELQTTPYYYYPEHLMCEPGNGSLRVSTIHNTYANFYDNVEAYGSRDGTNDTIKANAPKLSECASTGTVNSNGIDVNYDYYVDHSVVIDKTMEGTILIDLDNAQMNDDGGFDIVMLMPETDGPDFQGSQFVGDRLNYILVKNSDHDPEGDDARFVYFVSDSGVGQTNNEYGVYANTRNEADKQESTYDPSTFKTCNIKCGNGKMLMMDLDAYCRSGYVDDSYSLNPTKRPSTNGTTYDLPTGAICMLLTDGCSFRAGQQSMMQCTIFCPRASFAWTNDAYSESGKHANIEPSHSMWDPSYATGGNGIREVKVNILGSLICNKFEASFNDNTIVYQQVSTKSMVAITHGVGETAADESFQLYKYDSK